MPKAYSVEGDTLIIHRELTDLDLFVRGFLQVLSGHSGHLIIGGFVSISTGRTQGTEDVNVLVPKMDEESFSKFFEDLTKNGFWCYQGDDAKTVYPYISDMLSIRFARINNMFPNMEVIPITSERKTKFLEFSHPQKIKIEDFEFNIPPLEFEILYKEIVLGGAKDLADAKHLRTIFSDILNEESFKKFEPIVRMEIK